MFVSENRLPGIVYYGESKLPGLFTTRSWKSSSCLLRGGITSASFTVHRVVYNISFFWQKHQRSLKTSWVQSICPILMKFSENKAWLVFYTSINIRCSSIHTFVLNTIYWLRKKLWNGTKLATTGIVYYEELHMKYTTYCGESMLHMLSTTQSWNSPCCLQWGVTVTSGELIMKI